MNPTIDIKQVEAKLNFTFTQPKLLITALTHPSYRNESPETLEDSERLEFLGDAVLCLIVTEHLFLLFPSINEGTLSTARSALINSHSCCQYTDALGLGDHILIGKGERIHNTRGRTSAYANLFEAILGAVYLDGGLAPARQITVPLLPNKKNILPLMLGNPKNRLQQLTQKHLRTLPIYQCSSSLESPGYHVRVFVNNEMWGEGHALSKKEAEKIAAQKALEAHEHEN